MDAKDTNPADDPAVEPAAPFDDAGEPSAPAKRGRPKRGDYETLTAEEEQFAQLLFEGTDAHNAYRTIRPGVSENYVRTRANVLKKRVSWRVEELRNAAVSSKVLTIIERKEALSEMIRSFRTRDPRAAIAAIDALNKMEGVYVQKVSVSGELSLRTLLEAVDGATRGLPATGDTTVSR